ncbi:MAG: dual specificity protein phosphatase family protein [Candidatus Lindowbacteria bacterium]|nr:dual specificity protein phosphatase family protein [Candidatus Lindowbacteria bacterium]
MSEPMRPDTWAQPLNVLGIDNLHKVNDSLYRGAQPTEEGFRQLKKMGIKTIVNLRGFHSDKDEIGDVDLQLEEIKIDTWKLDEDQVIRFIDIVSDTSNHPVFVHCLHDAYRTGTMNAMYRIVIEGWSKDEAIREMINGDYSYHSMWTNLPKLIQKIDVERIGKKSGLAELLTVG